MKRRNSAKTNEEKPEGKPWREEGKLWIFIQYCILSILWLCNYQPGTHIFLFSLLTLSSSSPLASLLLSMACHLICLCKQLLYTACNICVYSVCLFSGRLTENWLSYYCRYIFFILVCLVWFHASMYMTLRPQYICCNLCMSNSIQAWALVDIIDYLLYGLFLVWKGKLLVIAWSQQQQQHGIFFNVCGGKLKARRRRRKTSLRSSIFSAMSSSVLATKMLCNSAPYHEKARENSSIVYIQHGLVAENRRGQAYSYKGRRRLLYSSLISRKKTK